MKGGDKMQNNAPGWQYNTQLLHNEVYGQDFKVQLIFCLDMCYKSHLVNVVLNQKKYKDIIDWDAESGAPMPTGWHIDADGYYYCDTPEPEDSEEEEEEDNG